MSGLVGEHVDYDSGPYKITIPSGKTVVQFGIQITDDTTLEGDEYFDVTIDTNSLPCGYTIGSIGQARVIIVTDDCKGSEYRCTYTDK